MKTLRYTLFFLLAAIGLTGCSCQQQLARLQQRCPECFDSVTGTAQTQLPIPEHLANFTFPVSDLADNGTVTFTSPDNITLTLNIDDTGDSLAASVHIPADTVTVEVPVTLPCPECPQCNTTGENTKTILALLAIVLFFSWMIVYNIRRFKNQ